MKEPEGKMGVLLVGLGAVSTTFIAGVEAIKRGLGQPIGSLTQYGTIRLGKRTEERVPRIRDFVHLAGIDDLVFGCWDIFEDDCLEAATKAGVVPTKNFIAASHVTRDRSRVDSETLVSAVWFLPLNRSEGATG